MKEENIMTKKILVIGAHTDDVEMMCGGTIVKFLDCEREVYYATFSFADKSLPEGFPEGTTRDEAVGAAKVLGIPMLNLGLFDYEVRAFPKLRQEILEDLIRLRKEINPDLIITHNANDTHQDHKVISDETFRAFKQSASIWGYESFKNNRVFNNDLYVKLSKLQIERKLQAISIYKSQIIKGDNREGIMGLAKFRGAQVNHEFAECFQIMRIIA
jgi:LmbE family N-acetylglucosaminyl deacetylase